MLSKLPPMSNFFTTAGDLGLVALLRLDGGRNEG